MFIELLKNFLCIDQREREREGESHQPTIPLRFLYVLLIPLRALTRHHTTTTWKEQWFLVEDGSQSAVTPKREILRNKYPSLPGLPPPSLLSWLPLTHSCEKARGPRMDLKGQREDIQCIFQIFLGNMPGIFFLITSLQALLVYTLGSLPPTGQNLNLLACPGFPYNKFFSLIKPIRNL